MQRLLQITATLWRRLKVRWKTRYLEKTTKSRTELRHQMVEYKHRNISAMRYIDIVARMMPAMNYGNVSVDHRRALREIYYKYDLKGLQYYIGTINGKIKRTGRELYKKRKLKRLSVTGNR